MVLTRGLLGGGWARTLSAGGGVAGSPRAARGSVSAARSRRCAGTGAVRGVRGRIPRARAIVPDAAASRLSTTSMRSVSPSASPPTTAASSRAAKPSFPMAGGAASTQRVMGAPSAAASAWRRIAPSIAPATCGALSASLPPAYGTASISNASDGSAERSAPASSSGSALTAPAALMRAACLPASPMARSAAP